MALKVVPEVYEIANARFVVQMAADAEPVDFESIVSSEPGLRQLGSATSRTHEKLTELAIEIEYGPALGELESALLGMLRRLVKPRTEITASDVLNYRHRVATKTELQAEAARLDAESDDMAIPLEKRKDLSKKANDVRQHVSK